MSKEPQSVTEKTWEYKSLKCKVKFLFQSYRCGYVGVQKGHPDYGKSYDDVDVDVHGGLTYGEQGEDNFYWLGFDCAYSGDFIKGVSEHKGDFFWTLEEVIKETNKLAEQLAKHEEWQCLDYEIASFLEDTPIEKYSIFQEIIQEED